MHNIDALYRQARQLYLHGAYDEAFPLLAEGDAADRSDIFFLEKLPLFFK